MAKVGRLVKDVMVQELTEALKERQNFFVAAMGALSATEADTLRKRLRASKARMLMIKRTLGLQGMSALQMEEAKRLFEGSIALVFPGEDLIPAAKLLADFAKENQEKLHIRGGLVEGQVLDRTRFEELANLPPRLQLIAHVVGALEAPLANLVWTLESVLGEVAWVLEEASKAKPPSASTPQAQAPTPAGESSAPPPQTPPPQAEEQKGA